MSEEKKKTQKDLLNDDKFIATLVDYNRDRYGVSPLSAEEALETFLEDYRSLNSNTVGAFNFINYAEDIKDEEFKKNLGDAYKTVDTELENFYADDSTSFGQKVEAVGEYAMYSILDPINVFGFGAGKLVAGTLGRQIVKNAVGKALGTKLKTGIAVGAGEGAVSASVDLGTQLAEKEIGAREEISPTQIAVAGGAGAILGGGIGALAARGTDKARLEMEELIPETKKDSGVPVIEEAEAVAQKDIETLFPYMKKQSEKIEKTKKKAGKEKLKPLDEKDVIEGEKFLQENFSPEEADLFRASLNNETMIAVRGAISDFVTENPASAAAVYKPGDRISEFVGNIFKERLDLQGNPIVGDVVPETNSTLQKFTEKLINRGISPEKFGVLFKADLSQAGRTMQKVGQLKKLFDSQDELGNFNLGLTDIAKKLNPEQQETLKYLREVDKSQSEFGSTYGQFVDLWRGLLVTSPATTLRNIIGSMLRVPSETSSRALDRAFQNWERSLLGREELPDLPNYKINGILSAFGNMSKSIEMARYIGKNFTEVDKKIFKTVEDFDNAFNTGKDTGIMAGAAKVVKRLNFLNMAQDRAIKSGAFIASIDREIIRAVRNGSITDEGINGIESIIRQNKLNLINNKMIDDAIADSYRMTYQIRDAGKETELPLIGPALSGFQKIVNSSPTLKILVPFPNFQANAFAYLTNRVPGLSFYKPIKSAISLAKKGGKEVAKKDRIRLTELDNKIKETTDALGQANKTEAASLRKDLISMTQERTDLQVKFGGKAEDLRKLKQGISESIDGMILLSVAYQIRDSQAGGDDTKWYELKDNEGKLYDLRPIFPLTPFLYIAEVLRRQMQGKTEADVIPETLSNDALEAMIGTSVRAGPIGKMFREGRKIFESESPFDKAKVGQLVGETVGYLAAGLLTPLRPVSDIARTFSDPESRLYLDPALKKNIDVAQPWYTNAWRAMMADLTRGVEPLVGGVDSKAFGKVPSYSTPTTAKEPSTRTTPVIKQLTGMAQRGPRDAVEGELLKMDIDPFRARMYSGVSEYDNIANRISGSLTEQVLLPYINSNEYQNKSFEEKKEILEGFFFQPSETKRDLGFFKGDFSNVRKQTNAIMAKEYPILTDLKNLRKQGSKKINKALEMFGATPDLSYVNERDPKNAARIKELKDTLDQINYNIKFRGDDTPTFSRGLGFAGTATEGRIQEGSLTPVRKNKGGYVSQMNELGFSMGGKVGDFNHPMTEAEREAGRRSVTGGRILRAIPAANTATQVISDVAKGDTSKGAETAANKRFAFKTKRGSTYIQNPNNTTIRKRVPDRDRGEPDGPPVEQPESVKTVYLERNDMNKIGGIFQNPNIPTTMAPIIKNNKAIGMELVLTKEFKGNPAGTKIEGTQVKINAIPKKGLYPVEILDSKDPRGVHFGNEIVEVKSIK